MSQNERGVILIATGCEVVPNDMVDRIRKIAPNKEVIITAAREHMERVVERIEYAVGGVPWELLERSPKLK